MLRKENFINDQRRRSYLSATYNRINRGKSVLIEGDYGVGKSRFLNLLNSKKRQTIQVESLFNIHETLSAILKKLNYDVKATYRRTPEYLEWICSLSNHIIVIDEVNDLNARMWPYLKRVIDAGVPIVFAGLPKVRTFLASEYPDILSRLKVLVLYPIIVEDFIMEYKKDFKSEAIEQIYMAVRGDMRKFEEICTDCLDRAKELKNTTLRLCRLYAKSRYSSGQSVTLFLNLSRYTKNLVFIFEDHFFYLIRRGGLFFKIFSV